MLSDTLFQHLKLRQSFFSVLSYMHRGLKCSYYQGNEVATLDNMVYFIMLKSTLTHQHTKVDVIHPFHYLTFQSLIEVLLPLIFITATIVSVVMYVCILCVQALLYHGTNLEYRGQVSGPVLSFNIPTFPYILGIDLKSPDMHDKCLFLLRHIIQCYHTIFLSLNKFYSDFLPIINHPEKHHTCLCINSKAAAGHHTTVLMSMVVLVVLLHSLAFQSKILPQSLAKIIHFQQTYDYILMKLSNL